LLSEAWRAANEYDAHTAFVCGGQMSLLSSGTIDDVSKLFPPGVDVAEGLQDLFQRLDAVTAFMEEHYDYQMASACLSQMSHLRSRACFAVRSHLMRLLDEAGKELVVAMLAAFIRIPVLFPQT
ncbi:Golgi transport complex subunit 3, partial [Perkinsus olseni]